MSLPAHLVEHLCGRRPAITQAWLHTLLSSPEFITPERWSAPQLLDHLPALFDDLADELRGADRPKTEQHARVHGRYRWEQHFRLDEVLREILLIRRMIFEEIERYLAEHEPSGAAVTSEARRRVALFFDRVLLYSAGQFAEQQQAQIEEDKRLLAAHHQAAHAQMQATDFARLRLLRTIAHELRNMLYAAVLLTENLIAEKEAKSRAELHEMLRRSHRQMTALVNQLLEMSPLLSGRESLRLAPLDMRAFAAEQCRLFGRMAASGHLTFRCDPPEGLPEVITDETKLQRIITNLVQNALKYTPPGGSVDLRFEPLDAERWRLSVSDTGPGIPAEHHAKIFEEFYRVPGSEQQEGTGLGLSIVRQLVNLFGGEVSLKSEVGRGSIFYVTLPRDPKAKTKSKRD